MNIDVNILQVEKHDNSSHEARERSYKILIVLLFVALGVVLVVLLLVFLTRRRRGTYNVSKNASGVKNNNPPSGVPVNGAPAL
jgi:flagellar basal body-associated protein FliL